MGLLSELLLLPLAPARFAAWTVDQLIRSAKSEYTSPSAIRSELRELSRLLDDGLIGPDEFDRREDEILDRLSESEAHASQSEGTA